MSCQTPVFTVSLFESCKISFQGVGGSFDRRIRKIVKHVWQSSQQHAPCAFEITKDITMFWGKSNANPVTLLPSSKLIQEEVSLGCRMNVCDFQKKVPKVLSIGALRIASTPPEALSLDMYQTALKDDSGPLIF
jgi:hypothetical protein